jgi:hypothetical protein
MGNGKEAKKPEKRKEAQGTKLSDPLGKRALYWPPSEAQSEDHGGDIAAPPNVLPDGKEALYSGAQTAADSTRASSDNPLDDRGRFTVRCQRCRRVSRVGLLDLVIFQFPLGVWIPRGTFDHRMTCPSCRRRSWCSVTLRRG